MRVAPVALVPALAPQQRSGAAQLQAALTHGHPTALAASDLTAHAVWLLAEGASPPELLPALRGYAEASRRTYRAEWLGDLAERAPDPALASFIAAAGTSAWPPWAAWRRHWPPPTPTPIRARPPDRLLAMGAAWDT